MRRAVLAMLGVAAVALAGCGSPEASRTRGGGAGADPGNHGNTVEVHGTIDMFHKTPTKAGK